MINKGLTKKIDVASAKGNSERPRKNIKLAKTTARPRIKCMPIRCVFKTENVPFKEMKITSKMTIPISDLTKTI